ncbi:MAG: Aromatic-L-amino-acid decarboxylase [uncultured Corynebacteriales bacterium]|uniref:Aromatic-L-amino-acid decarboxylase n=1 Tax=uncultured Mycobacteriales bacterium TaxID=581187 RepID=A0A6J4HBD0_9ACTN|nr:MAG: Aromatic-L-amino-acid decarboxylase [uncultured Corynebacteriales bacterium]
MTIPEESLDPPSWTELRALGHRMVEDMFDWLDGLRDGPVWQPMPDAVRERFGGPAPELGAGPHAAYADFRELVLPYVTGNAHPRFWGWVCGNGTGLSMLAEMLAAGVNSSVDGFDDAGTQVEMQVIDWCKEMVGFRPEASGLLLSGCSVANFVGLAVARNAVPGIKEHGVPGGLTVYGSTDTHSSVRRAVQLLGLGTEALRVVPTGPGGGVDVAALDAAIAADAAAGLRPVAVVGTAGTVNTGAIDDLTGLADVAARHGVWFHVDGAFGACAALSPRLRPLVAGLERADSLAFDLHKWMYFPYEAGVALVRSDAAHREAFRYAAAYMAPAAGGLAAGRGRQFTEYGPQLSREFRALKIWMGIKEHGVAAFRRLIEQNVDQARYLAGLVEASAELELLAPVPLNVVCLRYRGAVPADRLNALNRALLVRLQESGVAVPSHTELDGRYAIRVAITNHRSRREDFDLLVRTVSALGGELAPPVVTT